MINSILDFEKFIHDLIAKVAEFEKSRVIWQMQNAPRPKKPYITLHHFANHRVGLDEYEQETDIDGNLTIKGQFELTLQVDYYGDNAFERLHAAIRKLDYPTVIDACNLDGLVIYDKSQIRDMEELLGTQFEERANADLSCRICLSATDLTQWIEKAEIKYKGDLK